MFGIFAIILVGLAIVFSKPLLGDRPRKSSKLAEQIDKLWEISQKSIRDKHYLRAEKALLTILTADERNAPAYNKLGILYAKQRQFNDAIECFEIAQSLQPSASSLHNVGLIYFEVEKYEKAAMAFEQALSIEDNVSARHIAYAKVLEKLGNNKRMIEHLEKAVELDTNPQSVNILADALMLDGQIERAEKFQKIAKKMSEKGRRDRVKQPGRVNI